MTIRAPHWRFTVDDDHRVSHVAAATTRSRSRRGETVALPALPEIVIAVNVILG